MSPPPTILLPGTSPTKPQKHTKTDTRPERSLAAHEGHSVVATNLFRTNFLNPPNVGIISEIAKAVSEQVVKVKDAETQVEGYQSIPALLNEIARLLHDQHSYPSVVRFFTSTTQHPYHHPCGNQDTPDFLAMVQSNYDRLGGAIPPWHYLVSLGEWKPGKTLTKDELSQTGAYAGSLNQARPDNPCALVFSACRGCYVIGYSDPATWTMSGSIPWMDLNPLIAYIHSLHSPLANINDNTITLVDRGISESPHWNINDAAFAIDNDFKIIHVGRAHSCMTTVFQRVQNQDPLLVKDAWVKSYRSTELTLFKSLTSDGPPPGWVNIKSPTEDRVQLQTPHIVGITQRRKDRTVMENTGLPFDKCRKLSDAIAATYDILEADRWAVTKRRILHRDISALNILISPVVHSLAHDGARFIKGILNLVTEEVSSAILLDLDNGTVLSSTHVSLDKILLEKDENTKISRELSGTPMYIARGPSIGTYISKCNHPFPTLRTLRDPISQLYAQAYPGDALRSATGLVGTFNEDYRKRFAGKSVIQRPWHDAESTIFTLLLFLLRCSPEGSPKESQDQLDHMQGLYSTIRDSGIGHLPDARDGLLSASPDEWKLYLHQGLHDMAEILSEICSAVSPDYEFLQPLTDSINIEVVLHEVLQRLLLQWYYEVTTVTPNLDITFSQNLRRVPVGQAKKMIVVSATESRGKYGSIEHGVDPSRTAFEAGPSDVGGHGAGSIFSEMVEAGFGLGLTGEAGLDPGTSRMGAAFGHSMGAGPSAIHSRPGTKHMREESGSQEQMPAIKRRKKTVPGTSGPERQSGRLKGLTRPNYKEVSESESEEGTRVKDKKGKGKAHQRQ